MKTIIQNAASTAHAPFLDNKPLDTLEHVLLHNRQPTIVYTDVPLSHVVGLRKRKINQDSKTWRGIAKALHCEGWGSFQSEIEHYFTSELRENDFPHPESSKPLQLRLIGGAAYGDVGNHRLPAAMVWKSLNEGPEATFKKVRCEYYELDPSLAPALLRCKEENGTVSVYFESSICVYVLLETDRTWCLLKKTLREGTEDFKPIAKGKIQRFKKFFIDKATQGGGEMFNPIPQSVVELFFDRSLIENAEPASH
ncbi:hypothetical protein [Vibrio owensii]|uniref:hypothetical protein n=1 Tax=Vibrio owensii TaxID=696485 RepID=UPI004068E5F4